ncbi:hypothetical protein OWR29_19015 [Actinoplanes sp. Pm04-4]|uniref:Uncharacterized protein n=1 Tax=Paractinoplanes pyxinae TaxID=2997416 RepID=A0ABT4B0W6_9ACTN|nr:hypothetical protein [Actinoplanes pyxinae]MCY1140099.1 hypothetical protein [Actinoplanes pyxinae]
MTEFIVGESVLMDEPLSDYDAMRVFFELADERGHLAPSVIVDDEGQVLTHRDYSDRVGAVHEGAGAWAFCRQPLPEALGAAEGAGWVRQIAPHLLLQDSVPYPAEPVFNYQPYLQRFGSEAPVMLPPVANAAAIAFAPDGTRVCVLEERARGGYAVHEYELGLGGQRLIATFPGGAGWFLTEVAYGPDGRWVLVTGGGRACLIRVADGLVVPLPVGAEAAAWNPRQGPDALLLMSTDRVGGRLLVQDYDLATGEVHPRSTIESHDGRPLDVREMALSADERALVIAPVGAVGLDQAPRGGVWVAAVVELDRGTIDPVSAARFKTAQVSRRHGNPRWCERPVRVTGSTAPHPRLMERGWTRRDEQPPPVERWQPILDAVIRAWRSGTVPHGTLAQEFIQYALSVDNRDEALRQLGDLSRGHAVPRLVRQRIDDGRRLWTPVPADPAAVADPVPPIVPAAVGQLIDAGDSAAAAVAARDLIAAAAGEPWLWLAEQSSRALYAGSYETAARIALCSLRWHVHHVAADWSLARTGLGTAAREVATRLYVQGFTACTHLPERQKFVHISDDRHAESVRGVLRPQVALRGIHRWDVLAAQALKRAVARHRASEGVEGC